MARGDVRVRIVGDTRRLDAALARSRKNVGGFAKFAKGALLLGAGAAVAGVALSVKAFADFDAKMTGSLAIMGDVSDTMRTKMSQAAREVGKTTTLSATDAAESYFFLASAGLDAKQSIAALPQVAAFAQAGMFDMATATDLATDAQSALGLTSDDSQKNLRNLTRVTDVFVKANKLANASVQQFSEAMTTKAGAALKSVGKDIEEGTAVLAVLADQGIKGAEAGTALNIVFRDLQSKAIDNKAAFEKFGVAVFDSSGEMRNTADIVGDLEGALAGMSDEQAKATLKQLGFADKSVIFLQTLLGQSDAIREYEKGLRKAGGTTQEVADKQLKSFSAQLGLLRDKLVDVGITIGAQATPILLDAFDSIEAWWEDNGDKVMSAIEDVGVVAQKTAEVIGKAVGHILDNWDEYKKVIAAAVTFIVGRWVVLKVRAAVQAVQIAGLWIAIQAHTIKTAAVTGAQVAIMIGKWVLLKVRAAVNAAAVAGAWVVTQVAAIRTGQITAAQVAVMVGRWVALRAAAALEAGRVAAAWVVTQVAAIRAGAITAGQVAFMIGQWASLKVAAATSAAGVRTAWLAALGPIGVAAAVAGAKLSTLDIQRRRWRNAPGPRLSDLWPFDKGGVVPGPKGAPVPILAHGGETVLPTHKRDFSRLEPRRMAAGGFGGGGVHVGQIVVQGASDPQATAHAVRRELIRLGRRNNGTGL